MNTEILPHPLFMMDRQRPTEAARRQALEVENLRLRTALEERFRPENFLGDSPPMRSVGVRIRQAAETSVAVLIRGESQIDKQLVAAAIHYNSSRAGGPLVTVHCTATNALLESELFGQEQGVLARPVQPHRADRSGRRRHDLLRRNRPTLPRRPGQTSPFPPRAGVRARGRRPDAPRRRPRRRRHCPQPRSLRRGGNVSPGLVLPHQRLPHRLADADERVRESLAGVLDRPGPTPRKRRCSSTP